MKSIGIDLGTTTISINVVEDSGPRVWRKLTLPNDGFLATDHPWERVQDPDRIVHRAKTALEELLAEEKDLGSIGLTGQMHGIVYVDEQGRGVSPLYTWQDGRGDLPDFEGKSVCQLLREQQGIKAASGYGVITHLYLLKKGLMPSQAVSFCTIADYLGMALTGRTRPLLHGSQAASLGLFQGETLTFREDLVRPWGMDPSFPGGHWRIEALGRIPGDSCQCVLRRQPGQLFRICTPGRRKPSWSTWGQGHRFPCFSPDLWICRAWKLGLSWETRCCW